MSSEKIKTSWWSLTIQDYPNYKPNEADLEHIAKCIKEGYDQGELIQEVEDEQREAITINHNHWFSFWIMAAISRLQTKKT